MDEQETLHILHLEVGVGLKLKIRPKYEGKVNAFFRQKELVLGIFNDGFSTIKGRFKGTVHLVYI